MHTTVDIWFEKEIQEAFVKYDVIWGKPTILKVTIEGRNITDQLSFFNRAKIHTAITADSIRRVSA